MIAPHRYTLILALAAVAIPTYGLSPDACLISDRACVRCGSNGWPCLECSRDASLVGGRCVCPPGSARTGELHSEGENKTPANGAVVTREAIMPIDGTTTSTVGSDNNRRMLLTAHRHHNHDTTADPATAHPRLSCTACNKDTYARFSRRVRGSRCKKCPEGTTTRGRTGSPTCYVERGFYFDPKRPNGRQVRACMRGLERCEGGSIFGDGREHPVVSCDSKPCRNGGVCIQSANGRYSCECVDGFSGDDCEVRPRKITTVAGTGVGGGPEYVGPAAGSLLYRPEGVTAHNGAVYIADTGNHRVLRVGADGQVATFAGITNARGFSGDGGPAQSAHLRVPTAVAFDRVGNMFIADSFSNRIRKVDASGVISTFAGNGDSAQLSEPYSLALDSKGNVFVTEYGTHRVLKVSPAGKIATFAGSRYISGYAGNGGPASAALFYDPIGVAVDGHDNVLIADSRNSCIRRVDAASGIITTVVGSDESGSPIAGRLSIPIGVTVDKDGSLLISDVGDRRIFRVTAGVITTIAGNGEQGFSGDGGPATAAVFDFSFVVTLDASSNIYVADTGNSRIRMISAADSTISTFAGGAVEGATDQGGPATLSRLFRPRGLAVDAAGNLLIADSDNSRIRKLSISSKDGATLTTVAGTGASADEPIAADSKTPATSALIGAPCSLAIDSSGNIYFSDTSLSLIYKVGGKDGLIRTIAGDGKAGEAGDGGPATAARLNRPQGVAVDNKGNVYIADTDNHRVRKIDAATSVILTFAGNGKSGGGLGDGGPPTAAQVSYPRGIAFDPNEGSFYIAQDSCVRKVTAATGGKISTFAGDCTNSGDEGDGGAPEDARFDGIADVAVDSAGQVYIVDSTNNRVRVVGTDGILRGLAGTGDAGPALESMLNLPAGVAVDQGGNVFVSDSENHRVGKIEWAL